MTVRIVAVETELGVWHVDVDEDELVEGAEPPRPDPPAPAERPPFPSVAVAASGSTVVAVVDRRPPLLVSHDAGTTWHEAGGGLPPGRAVWISPDDPDFVVYAGRNRLFVSRDGARFWRGLTIELPEILSVSASPG